MRAGEGAHRVQRGRLHLLTAPTRLQGTRTGCHAGRDTGLLRRGALILPGEALVSINGLFRRFMLSPLCLALSSPGQCGLDSSLHTRSAPAPLQPPGQSRMSGCAPAAPVPRCSPGSALPHAAGLLGQLGELFRKAELNQVVLLLPGAEPLQRCCPGTHCSTAGPAAVPAWLWGHGTGGPTPPCSLSHLQLLHVSASLPKTVLPGGWEQRQPRSPREEPQLRLFTSVPSSAWGALQALLQLVQTRGSEPGPGSAGVSRPVVCLC